MEGSGEGQFFKGIACDSVGNVYVADTRHSCCRMFVNLDPSYIIAIDTNDIIYVSEYLNNHVSVFTSKGHYITWPTWEGTRTVSPTGVCVDSGGVVYVCVIILTIVFKCSDLCHTIYCYNMMLSVYGMFLEYPSRYVAQLCRIATLLRIV